MLQSFKDSNKLALTAEYAQEYVINTNGQRDTMCASSVTMHLKTLVLSSDLDDSFRYSCD